MKTLLSILLFGLAVAAWADTDVDNTYFYPAASFYIQGNTAGASNLVERGLAVFPDDGKLKRLKELLENQQQDEQQQDQNQDEQEQEPDQEQNQDEQEQEQDGQNQQDQQQSESEQQEQQDQQQPEPQRAEQMSQDEAERLLDAMKQEEKNKRLELHPVMGRPVSVEKDW
jgi:hypothetical protein